MNKVFVDTNVIIDFLANREPFSDYAAKLFQLAQNKDIEILIAAISINNTYYILKQVCSHKKALSLIEQIENLVKIVPTTQEVLRRAIKSDFKDFEDAMQYFSAKDYKGVDVIATRNAKDFKKSDIPVLTPETVVKLILNNKSL